MSQPKPVASPVTLQVNTPEVALSILRTGVENALGFYQVTHIHSFLREALKACEREPLTEADEEYPVTLSGEVECVLSNDNPKVGDCSVCKTSIWHKQGYMQDDDGKSYHIMCRVMQSSYEQIAALKAENAALLAKLAPVAVTLSEGQDTQPWDTSKDVRNGFICAEWEQRSEGPILDINTMRRRQVVVRCDRPDGHKGDHVDSVILVNWPQSNPAEGQETQEKKS